MAIRRAVFEFNPRDLERLRLLMEKELKGDIKHLDLLQAVNDVLNEVIIPKVSRGVPQRYNIFEHELKERLKRKAKRRHPYRTRKV